MGFTHDEMVVILKSCELAKGVCEDVIFDVHYGVAEHPDDIVESASYCLKHLYSIVNKLEKLM